MVASPNVGCFVRVLDRKPLLNVRTKHFELPAATLQTAFPRTQNLIIFLGKLCMPLDPQGAQPKIPEISVRNQMEQTISIRSDRNIWDHPSRWSSLTGQVTSVGRSDRNVPFHLTKLLSPVPLFCILLACARLSDSIVVYRCTYVLSCEHIL